MTDPEIYQRISALEAKVDHLYRLVRQGDKMGAMKQYRAETGSDLAVAQETINALSA